MTPTFGKRTHTPGPKYGTPANFNPWSFKMEIRPLIYIPLFIASFFGAMLLASIIVPKAHAQVAPRSDTTQAQRVEEHRLHKLEREREHVQNSRRRLAECLNTIRIYGGNPGECFSGGR